MSFTSLLIVLLLPSLDLVIDHLLSSPSCLFVIAIKLHNGHGRKDTTISHCSEALPGSRQGGAELLDPAVQRRRGLEKGWQQ